MCIMNGMITSIYSFFEARGFFRQNQNLLDENHVIFQGSFNKSTKTQSDSPKKANESLITNDRSPSNEWSFSRVFQEKMLTDNEINVSLSILKNQFMNKKDLKG